MKTSMTSKYFPPCDVPRVARGANWNKALIPVRRYPHMQRKISCTVIKLCVLPLPTIKLRHWHRPPTDCANLLTLWKKRENILLAFINECLPCSKWNLHNLHGWNLQKNVGGKKKKSNATFSGGEGGKKEIKIPDGFVRSAEGDTEWAALWW